MIKKKLFIIFHGRFPSEKAASLFAGKSAESFAREGVLTTLVVPRRISRTMADPYKYYNLEKNFKIVYLPTVDLFKVPFLKTIAFETSFLIFSIFAFLFLIFKAGKGDLIYSNESLPIYLSSFYFPNTLYELHDFPKSKSFFHRNLFKKVGKILSHNNWKTEKLESIFGVPKSKVILERNAVDIEEFDISVGKEKSREKLGLPIQKKIVVYTGHLYSWKGVDTLAKAANFLPEVLFIFVGGTTSDIKRFKEVYGGMNNVLIAGHKEHSEIPYWQKAGDVLVLPNTAKEDISKLYTSPMKLFEYMASGRPIVASRIISITEILNEKNSILVEPDNPEALASAISDIIANPKKGEALSEQAMTDVKEFTWDKRAKRILAFIS